MPEGPGLRARFAVFDPPQLVRLIRVRPSEGDGRYSVSQIEAFSVVPDPWPPPPPPPAKVTVTVTAEDVPSPPWTYNTLNDDQMVKIKGVVAALAFLVLLWGAWLERKGRTSGVQSNLLGLLAIASLLLWWNLLRFHYGPYTHLHDTFHYYMGGKYFPELSYTRLYDCVAVAEAELGDENVGRRRLRNLTTNELELTTRALADPAACKARFTTERWARFKSDVTWFRAAGPYGLWLEMQQDHGFNGTPVWAVAGRLFTSFGPAGADSIGSLTALDSWILLTMWGVALWGFGWRATVPALVFWGTNYAARYWWNGGSYLRMDWLLLSVLGVALLRRGRHAAAGFALTFAALLRVFPGLLLFALAVRAGVRWGRERKVSLEPEERDVLRGSVLALAVLVPLSFVAGGTFRTWPQFVENSRKHLATPLTNNVGLKTVVAFEPATRAIRMKRPEAEDPFGRWKEARRDRAHERLGILVVLSLAFLALFAAAAKGEPLWSAAALGACLVPVLTELTGYYMSILLVPGFLWLRRRAVGPLLAALAALTCAVPFRWAWDDDRHLVMSLLFLSAIAVTFVLVRGAPPEAPPDAPKVKRKPGRR